jgi:hypothetical protein
VTGAVVHRGPIAWGLATLSRRPDPVRGRLIAAGALFSLTVLAQSDNPTLYSAGRSPCGS